MTPQTIRRFWSKVQIFSEDACWLWTGAKTKGHGRFQTGRRNGKSVLEYAHRVAYRLCVGEIPEGLCVCHSCDVKPCCNPNHFFLGTSDDNIKDAARKGRMRHGEKHHNSKLDDDQIRLIRYIGNALSLTKMSRLFNIDRATIGLILQGKRWAHV